MNYEIQLHKDGLFWTIEKTTDFIVNTGDILYFDFVAGGKFTKGLGLSDKKSFIEKMPNHIHFKVSARYIHDTFITLLI